MSLQPHEKRVVAERDDLSLKLSNLRNFMTTPTFTNLDAMERGRLQMQEVHMTRYLGVLEERIEVFGGDQ